jgi:hypothetical protein
MQSIGTVMEVSRIDLLGIQAFNRSKSHSIHPICEHARIEKRPERLTGRSHSVRQRIKCQSPDQAKR